MYKSASGNAPQLGINGCGACTAAFQADQEAAQMIVILIDNGGATHHTGKWIFSNPHTQFKFIGQAVSQALQ
jgi:hypothetical protein